LIRSKQQSLWFHFFWLCSCHKNNAL
jgi:hypothetical protein